MLDVAPSTQTLNGWSNRETWLAAMWLTNDEGCYVLQEAKGAAEDLFAQADCLERLLRDQLKDEADEASLWSSLLITAFDRINWLEVIEHCS